jgi:hypothetical protein
MQEADLRVGYDVAGEEHFFPAGTDMHRHVAWRVTGGVEGGPLCEAALQAYFVNRECAAYIASDFLENRLAQLMSRIAYGERFTISEAADFLSLPAEVFRWVWAAVLSTEVAERRFARSG